MNLSEEAARLYAQNDNNALFELADRSWKLAGNSLPEGIGELCRLAAVRYAQINDPAAQHLWLARAMTAAVTTGDRATAAGLLLSHFFAAIAALRAGDVSGHRQARAILDEMKRLAGDLPSWSTLFGRLYHEKRGVSFLMEGTDGGDPLPQGQALLESARSEFSRALDVATGERDVLKVRGALALIRYLLGAYTSHDPAVSEAEVALKETRDIHTAAIGARYLDVAEWAAVNIGVMERAEMKGWRPYDVL